MYVSRICGLPCILALGVIVITLLCLWPSMAVADSKISFGEDIFPIIQIRCLKCHQPGKEGYEKSGFDLRTYEGLMRGTKYGPMVLPGDPFMSNLIVLIEGRASKQIRMPLHGKKLTNCDQLLFHKWVKQGALNN